MFLCGRGISIPQIIGFFLSYFIIGALCLDQCWPVSLAWNAEQKQGHRWRSHFLHCKGERPLHGAKGTVTVIGVQPVSRGPGLCAGLFAP